MRRDANDRGLSLVGAMGVGAALMYLFDPDRGRRRRALIRDQLAHVSSKTDDALRTSARDLGNRARGAVAEARARLRPEDVTDEVLAGRVRAELGRVVSHPHAILVAASDGRVTLGGPVLAREVDSLLAAVAAVRGVRDVESRLDVHDSAENVPSLQGGVPREGDRFELLQENWTPAARLLVGAAGGALALYGLRRRGALGTLLARGGTNMPTARLLGTTGRRAVDIQKTINIGAPIDQVFTFFSDYENFPRFMSHVREVRDYGDGRSHWVVDGPMQTTIEWDAVVTAFRPNEVLAWKSVEGSTVQHAGILRFERVGDDATRVDVRMTYNPPAGAAGHAIAVLFQRDPKHQMDDDLARMKTAIETGITPRDAAQPADADAAGR